MTTSRWGRRFLARSAAFVLAFALASVGFVPFFTSRPDVTVLCSNNRASCEAVVEAFASSRGQRVKLLRVSTSEALERLQSAADAPEFDVWIGGPTYAYATAEQAGLLESLAPEEFAHPSSSRNRSWFEIYGGILALCARPGTHVSSWEDLAGARLRLVAPSPLTSGTAATFLAVQHGRVSNPIDYLRAIDSSVVTYTRSGMAPATLVATGMADVGITFAPYCEAARAHGADVLTIFPADGTGYEIGGAALIDGSPRRDTALEFLEYVTSEEGQLVGADAGFQAPIDGRLRATLRDDLEALAVPVMHVDPYALARTLPDLVQQWYDEVYHARP